MYLPGDLSLSICLTNYRSIYRWRKLRMPLLIQNIWMPRRCPKSWKWAVPLRIQELGCEDHDKDAENTRRLLPMRRFLMRRRCPRWPQIFIKKMENWISAANNVHTPRDKNVHPNGAKNIHPQGWLVGQKTCRLNFLKAKATLTNIISCFYPKTGPESDDQNLKNC